MSIPPPPVSDLLVTVKSRELQRAMLAEMRGDRAGASRHFLAAAHLELVLAEDYQQVGEKELGWRSQLSAASCFWRAGQVEQARQFLASLAQAGPSAEADVQEAQAALERDYPPQTPSRN